MWGRAADDVFVVGSQGTSLHYDGAAWSSISGLGGTIGSVRGTATGDVFATGTGGTYEYNGTGWSSTGGGGGTALWVGSASELFSVGTNGQIRRYDGTSWSSMTSGTERHLYGVWGSDSDDVFAVGTVGEIVHFDGTSWSTMASGSSTYFFGVWGSGPRDVFAVGRDGVVLHFDGVEWSPVSLGTTEDLRDVWGTGPGSVYVVSDAGSIFHFDGFVWSPITSTATEGLHGIGGTTSGDVFAVGDVGEIVQVPRSCLPDERFCGDAQDNDCDGLYDCADSDCAADSVCVAGGLCPGAIEITCSDIVAGTTSGGERNIDQYACSDWYAHGREAYYRLDSAGEGTVTAALTGIVKDLELYVLREGAGGGCQPRNGGCVAGSFTQADEQVTFDAVAGEVYYIVVDGFGASAGDFTLSLTCM